MGDDGGLRVGFAGIGRMGLPMARNLLKAGFPLTVYNRTAERAAPLVEEGATLAETPAALAAAADVLVTIVADADAVRDLLEGPEGILAAAEAGLVLVEMSTIGPQAAIELNELCGQHGVTMIDAPVSGSTAVAEAAQLAVMAGGDADAFERARPVLAAMSKAQFHLGPAGAGAAMKLSLNVMIAATTLAVSEALVLAEQSGIDRAAAYEVIASGAVASPFIAYKREAFLDPANTQPAFALDLLRKDVSLALALGERSGVPLLGAAAAAQATALAVELEGGDNDMAWIAEALRRVATGRAEGPSG